MIELHDVRCRYGETLVVDGVSLQVPAGGITALIGPNGAGKSTLLSAMSRLLTPSSGSILVDRLDVATTSGEVLAQRLAILRQDNATTLRLTVRDLVAFGRYPHSKGRLTVADRDHIDSAIAYLGLTELADRFLDELSGGQRQRAFVAMVLCQDTDYVLLDEPLNNLDIRHAVGMMQQLRRAAAELGKAVVVVLHDINFASCYADRIVAMKDGRVVAEGPGEAVIDPDVLREVYGIEVAVQRIGEQRIVVYYDPPAAKLD